MLVWMVGAAALAAKEPRGLEIRVVDTAGAPVPSARVHFPAEGDLHRVNASDGSWAGDRLYPREGEPIPLGRGADASFWASAPGLQAARVDHAMAGSRKEDTVTVTLAPLEMPSLACLPEGLALTPETGAEIARRASADLAAAQGDDAHACLHAARAWGWEREVARAEAAYAASPTEETQQAAHAGRHGAITAVRDWHDWASASGRDTVAIQALCGVVRGWPGSCAD